MRIPDINPQDFGKLFMKYRDSYVAIARSYVRDLAVAEDIVSDCFATFWDKRESIDLKTSPEAYILRAVKNRCLNWLRDNAKFVQAEGPLDPETNLKIKSMLSEISILESPGMADFSARKSRLFSRISCQRCLISPEVFSSPAVSKISLTMK